MTTNVFPIIICSRGTCPDRLLVVARPRNAGQSKRQTLRRMTNDEGDFVESGPAFLSGP
ncbi:hypothetical protein C7417_0517 [Cupriavidus plantarum]|nr:hypothetical protein C7417_0517 [Cupriavidus plantarum]